MIAYAPTQVETNSFLTDAMEEFPTTSASGSIFSDYQIPEHNQWYDIHYQFYLRNGNITILSPNSQSENNYIDFIKELSKRETRASELTQKIIKEYAIYKDYVKISFVEFAKVISLLTLNISKINYEKIIVELSPLNEIKIKMLLTDDILFIITKPLEKLDTDLTTVLYSVFINKISILNDYSSIEEMVEGISKFLE